MELEETYDCTRCYGRKIGDMPGDPVQVTDHTGRSKQEGAFCEKVKAVGDKKVNDQLKVGRPRGRWGPTNQCQSLTREVLDKARTTYIRSISLGFGGSDEALQIHSCSIGRVYRRCWLLSKKRKL